MCYGQHIASRSSYASLDLVLQVTAQVSGVLRNLAASPAHAAAFLEAEALQVSARLVQARVGRAVAAK